MKLECVNIKEFQASLRASAANSKRTEPQIVNKAIKDVCLRTMQFTPFADQATIEAALRRDKIALKLAARKLSGRAGRVKVDRRGNTKLTRGGRAQRFAGPTRAQIAREAAKIIRRRKAGARAVRAGWIPAARAFGASAPGLRINARGSAAKGAGKKATQSVPMGFIRNALVTRSVKGNRRIPVGRIPMARFALKQAVAFVASDRMRHARQKELARAIRK